MLKFNNYITIFLLLILYLYIGSKLLLTLYLELNVDNLLLSSSVIVPVKTYTNLFEFTNYRAELNKKGGVYGLINQTTNKQYIGSSCNLYKRINEHLKGCNSNIFLQRAIYKYGLDSFIVVIYYFHKDTNIVLTDKETEIIQSFPFKDLYNFRIQGYSSALGYKHTSLTKINLRLKNTGNLNPFFYKKHSLETKNKISLTQSKIPIGLYDLENNLIDTYISQVRLAKKLNVSNRTI